MVTDAGLIRHDSVLCSQTVYLQHRWIYSDEGRRGARDSKGKSGAGKEGFGFVLQPQQTGHLAVNSSGYQSILEFNVRSFDI